MVQQHRRPATLPVGVSSGLRGLDDEREFGDRPAAAGGAWAEAMQSSMAGSQVAVDPPPNDPTTSPSPCPSLRRPSARRYTTMIYWHRTAPRRPIEIWDGSIDKFPVEPGSSTSS
jgi:hypothetical protein